MEELKYSELEKNTAEEIDNKKVEVEKELDIKQRNFSIVEQSFFDKQLKIIDLQKEKKELEISLSKEKSIIRTLKSQISILESIFWKKKNGR